MLRSGVSSRRSGKDTPLQYVFVWLHSNHRVEFISYKKSFFFLSCESYGCIMFEEPHRLVLQGWCIREGSFLPCLIAPESP